LTASRGRGVLIATPSFTHFSLAPACLMLLLLLLLLVVVVVVITQQPSPTTNHTDRRFCVGGAG